MTTLVATPREFDGTNATEREEFRELVGAAESALREERVATTPACPGG